ncbi:MAG: hypothetical protein EBR30_00035 [Cytophagia bacterium]|jgi:hypothetical protein|nr:hypothetical protein [Cytophagia bacterium]
MINFYEVANDLRLASNQVEAIRALLCITKDTYIDGKTLKMFAPDLPAVLRDWIHINNPEGIFFPCLPKEQHDNDFETDIQTLSYN